jgi:hypothetical protein
MSSTDSYASTVFCRPTRRDPGARSAARRCWRATSPETHRPTRVSRAGPSTSARNAATSYRAPNRPDQATTAGRSASGAIVLDTALRMREPIDLHREPLDRLNGIESAAVPGVGRATIDTDASSNSTNVWTVDLHAPPARTLCTADRPREMCRDQPRKRAIPKYGKVSFAGRAGDGHHRFDTDAHDRCRGRAAATPAAPRCRSAAR